MTKFRKLPAALAAGVIAFFGITAANAATDGDWTVSPMDETGSTISTDGDFVYGYAVNGCTVNGVTFSRQIPVVGSSGNITVSPAAGGSAYGDYGTEGAASPYGSLLSHGSYWTAPASLTLTFAGLTVGKTYQVQIVAHKSGASGVTVSAEGSAAQHICTVDSGVTIGASCKTDLLATVIGASGSDAADGEYLPDNVTVSGHAKSDNQIEMQVAPKSVSAQFFFRANLKP